MVTGTLYTYPDNFRAFKALIAAEYSGAKVKVLSQPPDFVLGETNASAEFLAKFPLGKVPAFESADGKRIFESNAIAYFLADEQMRGKTVADQAFVQQWISFADNEILPAACTWVFPCMGIMSFNKQAADRAKDDLSRALDALNRHLHLKTFLVGERISLADICVMANLLLPFKWVLDPEFRAGFVNVTRWFVTMVNQTQVKKVIGKFALCQKMSQFEPQKFAEFSAKTGKNGGKGEKAKRASKETEAASADVGSVAKDYDPFVGFPKSSFVLADFKKVYSNEDIKSKAIPYFWKNFDREQYSIWLCEYRYPEDLGLMFKAENLITGMFQRLGNLNKYAFASVGLFGKSHDAQIQGLWIWRGPENVFQLSKNWKVDYENYLWYRLDPEANETKALVEAFFLHEEEVQEYKPQHWSPSRKFAGHKLYSASIFK